MKKIIVILIFAFLISPLWAATQTAASCSYENVLAAYNAASAGDTVAIPPGSCDWGADGLSIAKSNIIIQGAGIGQTILTGTSKSIYSNGQGENANGLRITGIEFRGFSFAIWFYNNHGESPKNIRIDHCKFYQLTLALENTGHLTGVIDNNQFEDVSSSIIRIYGDDDAAGTFPFSLGASDAIFIESNTVTWNTVCGGHFITSRMGSHYVVRYNTLYKNYLKSPACGYSDTIDAHGTCEGNAADSRGSFTWEVYENTFAGSVGVNGRVFHMRGGQGLIYNNSITSWAINSPFISLTDYRLIPSCATSCAYFGCCTSYPCTDQINSTYVWGNYAIGVLKEGTSPYPDYIQEGRDFFNCGATSTHCVDNHGLSYTAYTYPHPLRDDAATTTTSSTTSSTSTSTSSTTSTTAPGETTTTSSTSTSSTSTSTTSTTSTSTTLFTITAIVAITLNSSMVQVTWDTSTASNSSVEYGLTASYELGAFHKGDLVTSHSITLWGLFPGKKYHLRVVSKDVNESTTYSGNYTISIPGRGRRTIRT